MAHLADGIATLPVVVTAYIVDLMLGKDVGSFDRFRADIEHAINATPLLALLVERWLLRLRTGSFGGRPHVGASDVVFGLWFLFNLTYLVGQYGQSVGRWIAGIRVVGDDGGPIGFWRALFRNLFAAFVSGPLLCLGFLWIIWDPKKRAWHDHVFGAYVIRVERGKSFTRHNAPISCLKCGASIPGDSATCSVCGWTYEEEDHRKRRRTTG